MYLEDQKAIIYRVFMKDCVFPRILERLPPLPHQHSTAIGCTHDYQPIGVTVHSHCVESSLGALKVSYIHVGEGGVAVNCKKTHFILNTPVEKNHLIFLAEYHTK